jgi:DNA repair protein RecO (recombination protein O)
VPAEKTTAIVIRVIDFSESSCVVTLFTREFGKITGLAKGARRPKSSFESALDLLAVVRIVFLRKTGDVLDLLTEAKLERRFRASARSLPRLYAGYYVAELLNAFTDDDDPHPEWFDVAERTLRELDDSADIATAILRFEIAGLHWLGHRPALDECVSCGNTVPELNRVPFGVIAGGVLCASCRAGQRTVVGMSAAARNALRREFEDWNRTDVIEKSLRGELRGLMNQYISHLLGYRPKMHAFFGLLMNG